LTGILEKGWNDWHSGMVTWALVLRELHIIFFFRFLSERCSRHEKKTRHDPSPPSPPLMRSSSSLHSLMPKAVLSPPAPVFPAVALFPRTNLAVDPSVAATLDRTTRTSSGKPERRVGRCPKTRTNEGMGCGFGVFLRTLSTLSSCCRSTTWRS